MRRPSFSIFSYTPLFALSIPPLFVFPSKYARYQVDVNNDGSIDFEEFMKMMRGTQKKKLDSSPLSRVKAALYRKLD